jgi:hypothetical protein
MLGTPTGSCTNMTLPTKGEPFGVASYGPSPADPNAANVVNSMAIKAEWIGVRIAEARDQASQDPALKSMADVLMNYPYGTAPPPPTEDLTTTNRPYAFGRFDTLYPDANNVCKLSNMNPSDMAYPDIPMHTDMVLDPNDPMMTKMIPMAVANQPATKVKYAWRNIRVIVSAESLGTQTFADLAITQDGCSANYKVSILVPKVTCADPKMMAEPKFCDAIPNELTPGSGIGQGIPTTCDNLGDNMNPDFECLPTKMDP